MAAERKTVRFFVDVQPGYNPFNITWNGPDQAQYHMNPPTDSKRLFFEVEMPSDIEIWPQHFNSGVNLGRVGHRRIMMDENTASAESPRPEVERG